MKIFIVLILFIFSLSCKNQTAETPFSEEKGEQKNIIEERRLENSSAIEVTAPLADEEITSPLEIKGRATGNWFFEADAPIEILDKDLNKIAESYITAEGEWMTKDFVEFSGKIEFDAPDGESGFLVFKRANPSDNRENDREHRIPIIFSSE